MCPIFTVLSNINLPLFKEVFEDVPCWALPGFDEEESNLSPCTMSQGEHKLLAMREKSLDMYNERVFSHILTQVKKLIFNR